VHAEVPKRKNKANMDNWKEDIIKERLGGKRDWTNAERMELSEQLDREIEKKFDEMVSGKSKNGTWRANDPWTEDNWKDKMKEHPMFTGLAADGKKEITADPTNPLVEGLAQIKFDPDHNSPAEIAQHYKEDGVHHFKYKKYNIAIANFTEGLAQNFKDNELRAQLLNNRAAAHYRAANYRQAIRDCEQAVSLKPDYRKAIQRAAESCDRLGCWQELITWADKGLLLDPGDATFRDLRVAAVLEQNKCEKITRRKHQEAKAKLAQLSKLLAAIKEHGVTLETVARGKEQEDEGEGEEDGVTAVEREIAALPDLEPEHPTAAGSRVQLNKSGELVWPVLLMYPEYQQTDFIQHFNERHSFCEQLEVVFGEGSPPAPWDRQHAYTLPRLCLYFEASDGLVRLPLDCSLREALADHRMVVKCGTPAFIICAADTRYQSVFEGKYRTVTRLD